MDRALDWVVEYFFGERIDKRIWGGNYGPEKSGWIDGSAEWSNTRL